MVRRAVPADAAEVTRLRRLMFESMGLDSDAADWEPACIRFFEAHFGTADVVGVVADAPGGADGADGADGVNVAGLAACGVIELSRTIPSPRSPHGTAAYISTISTDPRWRRRGLAAAIMDALLDVARAAGTDNVDLHATAEGRPLYERLGFRARPGNPALRLALTSTTSRPDHSTLTS